MRRFPPLFASWQPHLQPFSALATIVCQSLLLVALPELPVLPGELTSRQLSAEVSPPGQPCQPPCSQGGPCIPACGVSQRGFSCPVRSGTPPRLSLGRTR